MKVPSFARLPLPAQLAIFLICTLPLLWSLLFLDLRRLHDVTYSNSVIQSRNLAYAFAEEVKSSVNSIDYALIDLRDQWLSRPENFAEKVRQRQSYLEHDVGFQVGIIDANGILAFSSANTPVSKVDLSDREHFRVHRGRSVDQLFISEPVLGRISQRWSIQFTRPIQTADGKFAGVIVLSVSPDYFSRFYQTLELGKDSSVALIKSSGELLARSPNPDLAIGKTVGIGPFLPSTEADSDVLVRVSQVDGIERLYSWRALPKGGLVVLIGQSVDTIFAPYHRQKHAYMATGAAMSLLLTLIGYFILAGLKRRAKDAASLAESEARWKFALEGSGDGVWDWNVQSNEVQFSSRWKRILGFSDNAVGNRVDEWMDRIHPDDTPQFRERLHAHLDGAAPSYVDEHRMRCADGTWKWVMERGMVVSRTKTGKPTRMVGTFSDISSRKLSEEALHESMARLTAEQLRMKVILENSYDAFIAVDSSDRITNWNTKAEQIFGWNVSEVLGKDLSKLIIPEEQRDAHNAGFQHFTATGKSNIINMVVEVEALHRSGKRIPVELAVAGFYDGKGYAANAFIRDISARKEAERLDMERTRSLEETRKALQQSQKLEALGRLTGGIAHDFNNVLQTLTTGLQIALFSVKEQGIKSALEACERAVQRGVELTRQLRVFGRAQDADLKTVDPAQQLHAMVPFLRGALPSNIEFELDLPETLWAVHIDPLQFELAMLNLTMNARDAMQNGGRFTIHASNQIVGASVTDLPSGDYVEIVVSDTGEGMSPELLAKALDPFFTTKAIGKGSGMGLPQAYGFAKQMGGTLILQSVQGEGVTVLMYLPRSQQKLSAALPERSVSSNAEQSQGVVLFVEDDPLIRQTVPPALEAAGFKVTMADNGEDAVKLLETTRQVDLVFSDIVMPGEISGIDLADYVRARFPQIKVVLATGYSERRTSSPDIRILAKPYKISTLVNTLNEALLT